MLDSRWVVEDVTIKLVCCSGNCELESGYFNFFCDFSFAIIHLLWFQFLSSIFMESPSIFKSSNYCLINSSLWKADADLSAPSYQSKVMDNKSRGQAYRETFQTGSIKLIMAGIGCENAEKVEQVKTVHALFPLFASCVAWLNF